MKINKLSLIPVFAFLFVMVFAAASTARADGKQLFLDNKCNKCHEGAGIALLPKDPADAADADAEAGEKVETPKLDGMSGKLVKDFGSEAAVKEKLPAFLKKEAANSKGKKHKKAFKGADADLQTIIAWLLTLK